jgi:superfamily II DNA or RNA helicase
MGGLKTRQDYRTPSPKTRMADRSSEAGLSEGQIVEGDQFPEPMRVEVVTPDGPDAWNVGMSGIRSSTFRRVRLSTHDLAKLTVRSAAPTFDGDGSRLRLGLQAYSLGIAYEFDPYFGLSVSRVDPLPHQLEAVYDRMLHLPAVRFLLADDAGAGKTIMSGLLLRELKLRGLVERILIVCPANLTFQWQRELKEKFGEQFVILRGGELRGQFGMNPWRDNRQVITSLDLAKREDILPGLKQVSWDLVIVDEAHRMSAASEDSKSLRYRLGELLRDSTSHILLLTATPHKGDPENFSLFLQLLDKDAFAHVRSIQDAMAEGRAPFYLRRTKEAMVNFPTQKDDGTWTTKPIFTRRIVNTVSFAIDGKEFDLYRDVTRMVKSMSARAAAQDPPDPRARAMGFLMALYQRRLASSTAALQASLQRRAENLTKKLASSDEMLKDGLLDLPEDDEWEELEEAEREIFERKAEAVMLTRNRDLANAEIFELRRLATEAQGVIDRGEEAKLSRLKQLLEEEGFFKDPGQQLLVFTEYKDTLDYLKGRLETWGFRVGAIHGSMHTGSREDAGTRLFAEQEFREGRTQILVATEAAGEGINLQICHMMVNYDIPWNPNRLEQRMGRIHRYGQAEDCLIFNFVATNTIEGRVLSRLLEKLREIRDALDSDSVFNVVGEVYPASHIERIFRDYYAGKLGDEDMEERVLEPATEARFREICQNALEGLATKNLNIQMLVERRARAQEQRLIPENVARFLSEASAIASMTLKPVASDRFSFDPGPTPPEIRQYSNREGWKLAVVASRYPRITTDRAVADSSKNEWVTPGHPLFEALRLRSWDATQADLSMGACFFSLEHAEPVRLDFYKAKVVDGMGRVVHERLFVVELTDGKAPHLREPPILGDLQPCSKPEDLPKVATGNDPSEFLNAGALAEFLGEVRRERVAEVERIAKHVELSLTELISKEDEKLGRFDEQSQRGVEGAAGLLAQTWMRREELEGRRDRRRADLSRQKELTLQGVERIASALVLPHPARERPDIRNLRQDKEVEAIAVAFVVAHEKVQGRAPEDVSERNLGYDIRSVDSRSGELRLIEVKGLSSEGGEILLTPNEHRVAQDRPDCFWLYVVTKCKSEAPELKMRLNPAALDWTSISKVQHFTLNTRVLLEETGK